MELADLADLYGKELQLKHISKWLRSSARAQDIAKRSKLDSNDVTILEEHDQFYRDHKLLLTLFRGLAVMPVQRKTGKISFSWGSNIMIYAYFFYIFTTILVVMVGYERLDILLTKSKKFDEYIYSIIFIVFLIPHFWIPFVGWGVANEVCDYKNSWGTFQLSYYKVTGKNLQFPKLSILIVIISSGCLIVAVTFLLILSALLEGFTLYHTSAYIHIITMINMNCALWYINCRAIGNASDAFADSFEKDIKERCPAYLLAHYRVLWLSLSELLQKLGNAYARTYSTYCLFMMANITVSTYGFVSELVDHGLSFSFKEMGLIVDTVYCLMLLFIFCNCSHQASQGISYKVQNTLMSINLSTVDKACIKEIDLFLIAIKMNPPRVSLKGYTAVNRELLTSVSVSII
ncbi:hypothetical protein WA026_011095 [Henosepilachna vigintioctopunctata]|uniref:Gustatory receptor n=1 Tax=Henosepilachna vigintioctopunctata TaxID=420089 RepID=A0AAW1U5R6_9CUCU